MPQFNDITQHQKNLEQSSDTNLVSLPDESSPFIDQNLPANNLNSPVDSSFATNELLDALPQRWTRGLFYFLIAFMAIALPWGMLSRVDETGTARGRLEPQGGTIKQKLNLTHTSAALNSQTAKVEILKVKEGSTVKAGDILMELDSLPIRDRMTQLQIQLQSQKNRLNVLKEQKNQLETELRTQERQNQSQQLEKLSQVEQARQNFQSLKITYNLQEQEKLTQVAQAKQQLEDSNTAYDLAQIQLQKALGEVERYQDLFRKGVVAQVRVVEQESIANEKQIILKKSQADMKQANLRLIEQNRIHERIVNQGKADIKQAELRLAEQENSLQTLTHAGEISLSKIQEQLKNLNGQTNSLESDLMQTEKEIDSLKLELKKRVVTAQVGGTIFNLGITGVGDVVQQGAMIVE
ncbi:biotin/lipoyl-binding protein, partial [Cylindrospermopsis raciborskii CS-506_B]